MPRSIPRVDNSVRRIKPSRFFVYPNLSPMTFTKRLTIAVMLLSLVLCVNSFASEEYSDIQVLRSDQNGIVFKYKVPELSSSKFSQGDTLLDLLSIEKCPLSRDDGYPQVPSRIVVIGIPLGSQVDVRVVDQNSLDKGKFDLPFFEKKAVDDESRAKTRKLITEISSQDIYYPQEQVTSDPPAYIRNQRILRLKLFPVQYNPARKAVKYYTEITVEVDFTGGEKTEGMMERDLFENVYKETILNYDIAKNWRKTREIGLKKILQVNPFSYSDTWYKITLRDNGIYKIDGNALANAGINLSSVDPQKIRIFSGGGKILPDSNSSPRPELRELAILVSDGGDNKFDANDYILFYGWSVNNWEYDSTSSQYKYYLNPYTRDNIYWLTFTGSFPDPAKRMEIVNGSPDEPNPVISIKFRDRIHTEDDRMLAEDGSGEPVNYYQWYWQRDDSFTVYPSLVAVFPGDTSIIRVRCYPNYIPSASLDGSSLQSISSGTFVTTNLTAGLHTLRFHYLGATYLDYYEIEYSKKDSCYSNQLWFENPNTFGTIEYRTSGFNGTAPYLFEIEDRFGVKKFENFIRNADSIKFQDQLASGEKKQFYLLDQSRFKTPISLTSEQIANLRDVSNQADLLVITHSDFYDQLQEYKNLRESLNGIRVKLVRVQDIYNEFSWGLFDPVAIRDFLKYTYENWSSPAPAFALLVGDGTYDYKDLLGTHSPTWIPPFAVEPDESVSDDNFVYFGNYGNLDEDANGAVDMFIGRWPVKTPQDVQVITNKIIEYEVNPEYNTWKNLITLVADDEFGPTGSVTERVHTDETEDIADHHLKKTFNLNKVYLMEYPFDAARQKPEAEQAIINAFNNGTVIVNYVGHGNPNVWAHERVFKREQDIPRLKNKKRYPLVYAASCSIGLFFNPYSEGMAEDFLRAEDKGAISVISATWLVYSFDNAALNAKVYDLLLTSDSLSISEALYIAKLLRRYNDNDRQYIIIGDPMTNLDAPELQVRFVELNPDTLKALSRINFKGEVIDKTGQVDSLFKGTAYLLSFDSDKQKTHTMPDGGTIPYTLPGNVIFRGIAMIDSGQFAGSFIVPKDMEYGGKDGRISAYVVNSDSTIDGAGALDSIAVAGTDTTVKDSLGPEVRIAFVQNPKFIDGDTVQPDPGLIVYVSDSSGINLTGELGHRIILSIDDDWENTQDLTSNFQYDLNSYSQGSLTQKINLKEGDHTLKIKAWDNANNSTRANFQVKVISLTKELSISQVMNYPNPFSRFTQFTYELSVPAERVEIKIFTLSGRLIRTMSGTGSAGFNSGVVWDGRDQDGDKVANGVYIYKVVAKTRFNVNGEDANKEAEAIGKAVVMN